MILVLTATAFTAGLAAGALVRWGRMKLLVSAKNRAIVRAHFLEEEVGILRGQLTRLGERGIVVNPTCLKTNVDMGVMRAIASLRAELLEANQ